LRGNPASGGSGVVIIRYPSIYDTAFAITGGTATTSGIYTVRSFTSTGSLVIV
jgi:hypothetical protein